MATLKCSESAMLALPAGEAVAEVDAFDHVATEIER
jgi:hypothetical protein